MKHIEIKHIETALDWVDDATDEQLEDGITAFSEKQPVLLDYVLAAPSEYENEAIKLAVNPEQLITIRSRLMENRLNTALFNTPLFTKNIETAYMKIYDRHTRGLAPIDIDTL